ncbi:MAG: hypothetical protein EOO01_20060 [Chitinophagaceae bacterium]|nr:MAG: hypothetical protein EOO01_20060 [Chitinophagaceae bacterium]
MRNHMKKTHFRKEQVVNPKPENSIQDKSREDVARKSPAATTSDEKPIKGKDIDLMNYTDI